ncbi:MAG: hypothetical protein ABI778_08315 [Ignavibacteriota bacterium]
MKKSSSVSGFFLVVFGIIFLYGCSGDTCGSRTGEIKTVNFSDSIKIPLTFDSNYVFVRSRDSYPQNSSDFELRYSNSLLDSVQVIINIVGNYLYSTSLKPINTSTWTHDTVSLFFDYLVGSTKPVMNPNRIAKRSDADSILCSPVPESFSITHTFIEIPRNRTVDSIGHLSWKIK